MAGNPGRIEAFRAALHALMCPDVTRARHSTLERRKRTSPVIPPQVWEIPGGWDHSPAVAPPAELWRGKPVTTHRRVRVRGILGAEPRSNPTREVEIASQSPCFLSRARSKGARSRGALSKGSPHTVRTRPPLKSPKARGIAARGVPSPLTGTTRSRAPSYAKASEGRRIGTTSRSACPSRRRRSPEACDRESVPRSRAAVPPRADSHRSGRLCAESVRAQPPSARLTLPGAGRG